MLEDTNKLYKKGKKTINELLLEKAYEDVKETLKKQDINIDDVDEDEVETMVADRLKEIKSQAKGFTIGTVATIAFSLFTGF